MATTTSSTYSNVILNEVMRSGALASLKPKFVALEDINRDSIDGASSLSVEYAFNSDIGAASSATEGTDISSTTTLALASSITVTPTEGAGIRSDITTRALRRRLPGVTNDALWDLIEAGDMSAILPVLAEEAPRLANAMLEKAEVDVAALYDDFSDTSGSTGVDLTIANLLTALYKLKENEPEHEDFIFKMHPQQTFDLQTVLLTGGTGATGAAWFQQADANVMNQSRNDAGGLRGSFLGIPWKETSPSVNPLPNAGADVAGVLVCRGEGAPGPGAQNGGHVFVEGHPMRFVVDVDKSARMIELIGLWEYGVAELRDAHGVSIITDAP